MSLSIVKDSGRCFTVKCWLRYFGDFTCTDDALAPHFTHVLGIGQEKLFAFIDFTEATRELCHQGCQDLLWKQLVLVMQSEEYLATVVLMKLSATVLLFPLALNLVILAISWIWDVNKTNQICESLLRVAFEKVNRPLPIIAFFIFQPRHTDVSAGFAVLVLHNLC